jgi:hypothetical protein
MTATGVHEAGAGQNFDASRYVSLETLSQKVQFFTLISGLGTVEEGLGECRFG